MGEDDRKTVLELLSARAGDSQSDYHFRLKQGLDFIQELAHKHQKNPSEIDGLYDVFKEACRLNSRLIDDCSRLRGKPTWESRGLKLCLYSSKFVEFFPSIQQERKTWTLLDHLQYEIIRFNYFSGIVSGEKYEKSKQAMSFLLEHRNDDEASLMDAAQSDRRIDKTLLSHFNEVLKTSKNNLEGTSSAPTREPDEIVNFTPDITIKVKEKKEMITVGPKSDGENSGRFKVKRIKSTPGRASEAKKYLNLWIEKDSDPMAEMELLEPAGGALAQSIYPEGTPKARMLITGYKSYSSINKFQRKLIIGNDICKQANFNPSDTGLLGRPVVGLISVLITSIMVLNNNDFHEENFGVFYDNNKLRFFLFDFDKIDLGPAVTETNTQLLNALETDDVNLIKTHLKAYIKNNIIMNGTTLAKTMQRLVDNYDEYSLMEELNDIVNNRTLFLNSQSNQAISLLPASYGPILRERLDRLCNAINKFIALHENNSKPSQQNDHF